MAEKIGLEAVFVTSAFDAGLRAYSAGLHTATRITATASRGISAFGQIAIGALRQIGVIGVNALQAAGRAALRFTSDLLRAAFEGSDFENTMGEVYASLVNVTRTSLSPLVAQLNTLATKSAPAFLAVVQVAGETLGGLGQDALAYGQNLVSQFAQGMWDGLMFVLDALSGIGNLIASWLSPGSPPRILPNIDQWGTDAMNEWLSGWGKADFGIFREISSTIEGLIRSTGDANDTGLIPRILGSRESIARAVDELREAGTISAATMDGLIDQVGMADSSVRGYLESIIELEAANQAVSEAQADLNAIMAEYERLLKPIDDDLAAISEEQLQLTEDQKKSRLQLILADPNASISAKRQAALEIERIAAERARRALLSQQAIEVAGAEDRLDAATQAQIIAQDNFSAAQSQIDMLGQQNKLIEQQIALLERLAQAGVTQAAPKGGPVKPSGIFTPDPAMLEALRAKLEELRTKIDNIKTAWIDAWTAFKEKMQPVTDFINNEVLPLFGDLWSIIKDEGAVSIATFRTHWNEELRPDMEAWATWAEETLVPDLVLVWTWIKTNLPEALQTFLDKWNEEWFPAFLEFHNWLRDKLFVAFTEFYAWIRIALPLALIFLKTQIDKPVEAIRRFLAKLKEWAEWLDEHLPESKDAFADMANGVKIAADAASGAISGISSALSGLWDWLQRTFTFKIDIPPIIIPGSPTPFEMGLRGIASALQQVEKISDRAFGAGSSMSRMATSSPGMTGGGSSQSVTNNNSLYYQPQYTTPARGAQADAAIMAVLWGSIGT